MEWRMEGSWDRGAWRGKGQGGRETSREPVRKGDRGGETKEGGK